jgi:hypothetical protein
VYPIWIGSPDSPADVPARETWDRPEGVMKAAVWVLTQFPMLGAVDPPAAEECAVATQEPAGDILPFPEPRRFTDTRGLSEDAIRRRLAEVKEELGWAGTTGSARKWWEAFERENANRAALVLRLAEELAARGATIAEFFLAYVYSNTDNIQANLHYMDYRRLKEREEEKKREEEYARSKEKLGFDTAPAGAREWWGELEERAAPADCRRAAAELADRGISLSRVWADRQVHGWDRLSELVEHYRPGEVSFVRCKACGSLVPATATSCRVCGTPLRGDGPAAPGEAGQP